MHILSFHIDGLSCISCVKLCTMKFKKLGATEVSIDLATGAASVTSGTVLTLAQLAAALTGTHYTIRA